MLFDEKINEIRRIHTFPPPYSSKTPYKIDTFHIADDYTHYKLKIQKAFKLIVLGDLSVGKTCIINRYCRQVFNGNYKATIGVDFEIEIFSVLENQFSLQIWDTAGQERFKSIAQSYYRGAHAIVVVFDMSNIQSLQNCEIWAKEALNAGNTENSFLFLVGNKSDLLSKTRSKTEEFGLKVAQGLEAEYWSVSAKTGKNVEELFDRIAALIFSTSVLENDEEHFTNIPLGTNLVSFKENSAKNHKESTKCSCNK